MQILFDAVCVFFMTELVYHWTDGSDPTNDYILRSRFFGSHQWEDPKRLKHASVGLSVWMTVYDYAMEKGTWVSRKGCDREVHKEVHVEASKQWSLFPLSMRWGHQDCPFRRKSSQGSSRFYVDLVDQMPGITKKELAWKLFIFSI